MFTVAPAYPQRQRCCRRTILAAGLSGCRPRQLQPVSQVSRAAEGSQYRSRSIVYCWLTGPPAGSASEVPSRSVIVPPSSTVRPSVPLPEIPLTVTIY